MRPFIIFSAIILLMASCTKEDEIFSEDKTLFEDGEVIFERPADNPWIPYVYHKQSRSNSERITVISTKDCLGYSFKSDVAPLENMINLGYKVIDIEKLSTTYPDKVRTWKILTQDAKSFSFSDFDNFSSKSEIAKKIKTGHDLKLLFLSFGHKHTFSSLFGESLLTDSNSVLGELDVIFRDSCYELGYTSSLKTEIQKSFVSPSFIHDYHYMRPYEFFQNYGGVVAANFYSGGRAMALYAGVYNEEVDSATKERNMDKEIESSFSWSNDSDKPNSSFSNNLSFGRGKNAELSITKKFSSVKMAIKTLGGNASSSAFSMPQEVGKSSINLSSWVASLDNPNNHVISEFADGGLIPITDFILEDNIRSMIKSCMDGAISNRTYEPQLFILKKSQQNENPYEAIVVLLTKHGQYNVIGWFSIDKTESNLYNRYIEYVTKYRDIFKLKITQIGNPSKPKAMNHEITQQFPYRSIISHSYTKIESAGILYLIDEIDKVGFSIPNNQQWINEYGLNDFITSLSPSKLTYQDFVGLGYYITGL